jgi:peptidoglycan hydrolase CwlO-like protein
MHIRLLSGLFIVVLMVFLGVVKPVAGEDQVKGIKDEIEALEKRLQEIQGEKQSLAQTINLLTTRMQLTQSQIDQTQGEITTLQSQIETLAGKIGVLDTNLDRLTIVMVSRVNASYKQGRVEPFELLLMSDGLTDFFRRYKYMRASQQHDRKVIFALEEARTNYDAQKQVKEQKQAEMELLQAKLVEQKASLDSQQRAKQQALVITRNDERRYQQQLAQALAELQAIQSIIAGKGKESEVGPVKAGEKIASVIPGPSACSTGAHLHFEVVKDNKHQNPATYLSSKSVTWSNKPDGPFGFGGSWSWPIPEPITITQGFGMTFYAATMKYYGGAPHTGIDMVNSSNYAVMAVQDGTLFRGAIGCGGGTLRYVRVTHTDGLDTYYLHVNY